MLICNISNQYIINIYIIVKKLSYIYIIKKFRDKIPKLKFEGAKEIGIGLKELKNLEVLTLNLE